MKPDPAIENIRRVRRQISQKFDHDPVRLIAHYLEYQKQFGDRLLDSPSLRDGQEEPDDADPIAPDPPIGT